MEGLGSAPERREGGAEEEPIDTELSVIATAIKSSPDPLEAALCLLNWLQGYIWRLGAVKTNPTVVAAIGEIEADLLRETTTLRDALLG